MTKKEMALLVLKVICLGLFLGGNNCQDLDGTQEINICWISVEYCFSTSITINIAFVFLRLWLLQSSKSFVSASANTIQIIEDKKTWDEALKTCTDFNGSLIVLDTAEKISQLIKNPQLKGSKYWIGLRKYANDFKWIGEKPFKDDIDTIKGKEDCVTIKKGKDGHKFETKKCDTKNKFICQDTGNCKDQSSHIQLSASHTITQNRKTSDLLTKTPSLLQPTVCCTRETILPAMSTKRMSTENKLSTEIISTTLAIALASSSTSALGNTPVVTNKSPITTQFITFPDVPPTTKVSPQEWNKKKIAEFHSFLKTVDVNELDSMEDLFENYDELIADLDASAITQDDFNLLVEAHDIEHLALDYAKVHMTSNNPHLWRESEEIVFQADIIHRGRNSSVNVNVSVNSMDSISLPEELFQKEEVKVVILVFKNHKNASLPRLTPKTFEGKHNTAWLNTGIVSINTDPKLKEPLQENIQISFELIQVNAADNPSEIYCSFWNYTIPTSINGSWSNQGCRLKSTNGKQTVCECNHMTNFAVLMQLKPEKIPEEHYVALATITYVGLILSLVGEAITVACYCIFLKLHNEKIQIRINLLCVLAAAQIVMMAGITETHNKGGCVFVAVLIHYLYLASFCWMLMEGVYLYRMVVQVFDAGLKMRFAYIFSYVCPAPFVLMALFVAELGKGGVVFYTNKNYCWVNFENQLIWFFVAPVLTIVTINSVLLFCVIKEMFSMKTVKTVSSIELSMIRASIRACVVLLPLLGITWIFGLLSLADIGVAWQYIFTILNATQGVMIFIFHCLRNTELRTAVTLRLHQWESNNSHHHSRGRVTPTKLNKETKSSEDSPRNSVPTVTPTTNKVIPNNTI